MKKAYLTLLSLALFIIGCENRISVVEIDDITSKDELNLPLKVDANNHYRITKVASNEVDNNPFLRIDVSDEFSIRGKAKIDSNKKYRMAITLKNENANPVITYSYWEGLITSVRSFTVAGKNGNPPTSQTQKIHDDWVTFYEIIDAQEGENAFMLSLFSNRGTFYLKEISIKEITF